MQVLKMFEYIARSARKEKNYNATYQPSFVIEVLFIPLLGGVLMLMFKKRKADDRHINVDNT